MASWYINLDNVDEMLLLRWNYSNDPDKLEFKDTKYPKTDPEIFKLTAITK